MRKRITLLLVGAVLFVAGGGVGVYSAGHFRPSPAPTMVNIDLERLLAPSSAPVDLEDVDFNNYWLAWEIIKSRHVNDAVKDKDLYYGAMRGMVESLKDPHSSFFTPEDAQSFREDMNSAFFGIGAVIGMKDEQLTIIAPMDGSPASAAGVKAGDVIVAIDGETTEGMTVFDAVKKIRGPKGTEVKLTLERPGRRKPLEIAVIRDEIKVDTVKWKMVTVGGKRLAVITISGFHSDTVGLFNRAMVEILPQEPVGVILDLRNNPGGYLVAAVRVASAWIEGRKAVVETRPRFGDPEVALSTGAALLANMPTVVLVNKGSASASEIVAGALQDYGKARVIGETTYGKGSGQQDFPLADGSVVHLTTFLWYTPNGRSIQKDGIEPDETVVNRPQDLKKKKDAQLIRAIRYLLQP